MLPSGFKVNGTNTEKNRSIPVPPKVKKIIDFLESLPFSELLTSTELLADGLCPYGGGHATNHPALIGYKEKVDNKLYWGNKKTITDLRKKLAEESCDQN